MKNKYATKTLNETFVKDRQRYVKLFYKHMFGNVRGDLFNKKILCINIEPLATKVYDDGNEVFAIVTSQERMQQLIKERSNIKCLYCDIDIKMKREEVINKLIETLKHIKKNSMDHIFVNLPFKGSLHLEITELLQQYLKEDGKIDAVQPITYLASEKQKTNKRKYNNLLRCITKYTVMDPEDWMGKNKLFEELNDYTWYGIVQYGKKDNAFDQWSQWRIIQEPSVVKIIDKIKLLNLPTVASIVSKNVKAINDTIILPFTDVTGGYDRTNRLVYTNAVYVQNKMIFDNSVGQFVKPEDFKGQGKPLGKDFRVSLGYICKDATEAQILFNAYNNYDILQGFTSISCYGNRHIERDRLPWVPASIAGSYEDTIEYLGLDEEDILTLRRYSVPCKIKQTSYVKERIF